MYSLNALEQLPCCTYVTRRLLKSVRENAQDANKDINMGSNMPVNNILQKMQFSHGKKQKQPIVFCKLFLK